MQRNLGPEHAVAARQRQRRQHRERRQHPGDGGGEEQRRRQRAVGDGEGELRRGDITPQLRLDRHEQQHECQVPEPGRQPAEIGTAADQLVRHPEAGRVDEVAEAPVHQGAGQHTLHQVGQAIGHRHRQQRRIAKQHHAQEHRQVFQRFERLRARHQHDEGADIAGAKDGAKGDHGAKQRAAVPALARPAQAPAAMRLDGQAAVCGQHQHKAQQVAEAAPHLQQVQGDGAEDSFQPLDHYMHGSFRQVSIRLLLARRRRGRPVRRRGRPLRSLRIHRHDSAPACA